MSKCCERRKSQVLSLAMQGPQSNKKNDDEEEEEMSELQRGAETLMKFFIFVMCVHYYRPWLWWLGNELGVPSRFLPVKGP